MRRKYEGYIFQFTLADHAGQHIHVFKDDRQIGVYDRNNGPTRGLEKAWNNKLRRGLERFINDLNERGFFQG